MVKISRTEPSTSNLESHVYYLNVPLSAVAVPPVHNPWRHGMRLLGVWVAFMVVIDVCLYLVADLVGFRLSVPGKEHLLELYGAGIIALLTLVFVYTHNVEARAKHWREAAYPVYQARLDEVKAWSWEILGAENVGGEWHVAGIHRGNEGAQGFSVTIPEEFVTEVPGVSDSLVFGDIRMAVSRRPGHDDKILIGGHVTLNYKAERGCPLPLPRRLSVDF